MRCGTMAIHVLPPAALWLACVEQVEQAVEVYALAKRYKYIKNSGWIQDVFDRPIRRAGRDLAPETIARAQARGEALDVVATVRELLAYLNG